ncbi:outer membrane protein [Legionella tucsonensis]|uniref:Outer membrane protein beta-barrel domain-containing protein n=1 Tax=Legionella tucsonensis TaxID=40335 RepID=A0A0W0ZYT5_9GAMM|nr:outer membrane beta-barrel protein [Legionella tucsonensis]KTD74268.1 hypothetical protein Ltuc_2115 [Legionella tucsonensis]
MRLQLLSLSFLSSFLCSTTLLAGESDIQKIYQTNLYPVISILGGYANMHVRNIETYYGDDDNIYLYRNSGHDNDTGVGGIFLGLEYVFTSSFLMQLGVDYAYFGSTRIQGIHSVGIEPSTSTQYQYKYKFQPQQLLAATKLLTTVQDSFHPYLFAGLGVSFNRAYNYDASTHETCDINLTPLFKNNSDQRLSFTLGAGVDANLNQHFRFGLGYRFSDFGTISLGEGNVNFDGYTASVPFSLRAHDTYAHQFIAQLSYLI